MAILFDKNELLELFWNLPNVINKESHIYKYETKNEHGFVLNLYISAYEEFVAIRLEYEKLSIIIYDIPFSNVKEIEVRKKELVLFGKNKDNFIAKLLFYPTYSLVIGENFGIINQFEDEDN